MNITTQRTDNTLSVAVIGKLDSTTSAAFDSEMQFDGVNRLVLDFSECH